MTRSFDRILTATVAEPVWPVAPIDPRSDGWGGDHGQWKWFYAVSAPADIDDEERFPNLAQARREYAALPAERRAELERTWR